MHYFWFFLFLLSLAACNSADNADENTASTAVTTEIAEPEIVAPAPDEPVYYRTTVDELRLREAPDSKSRVIMKLPLRERVLDLGEVSDETFTATLGGKKVTDVWRKVSLAGKQDGQTIEGWTFGGGLEKIVISYSPLPDGHYERILEKMPANEVAKLISLDVNNYMDYQGRISYRKTPTGLYLLDGYFEVVGEAMSRDDIDPDIKITTTYMGNFADGKLNGEVKRLHYGYEAQSEATINFINGRCTWGLMTEEGEGMVSKAKETEMGTCSFKYLEDALVLQE